MVVLIKYSPTFVGWPPPEVNGLPLSVAVLGGVADGVVPAPKFRPESVIDYEVGWKGSLFDGHIRTQFGGFYENYKGFQVAVFNPQSKQADTDNDSSANCTSSTSSCLNIDRAS